ncbi:uncharacterized protein BCR38DRAFT_42688 [Pseudomassariella vexata]|uniref:Uncharacterized protein n=1 Tax=Pseudomassariella vexata TaxID=1141098 RepID=A0A1Y2DMV5_9PEZI|nr:uncharacterized protein BCR38DRAFT_42688 [Pseudomassariella vexata]ORY60602.1 hypothetical protein BCR38DRAFT_42688 [Pseudomassariella vexata]
MASSQNPNRTLSSAAAAAALRARPQTPTNVAEVQTKRTMRRSPSVSSTGSAAGRGRTGLRLERRGSSGSMTERTFRSPSPHRGQPGQEPQQHPPVPTIPAGHRKSPSTGSAAVGMQKFRTASQKMDERLPSWYTHPTGDLRNIRKSDAPMNSLYTQKPRPESINSIPPRPESTSSSVNFSYPSRMRSQSPPASPSTRHDPQWSSPPPRTPASPLRSSRASATLSIMGKPDAAMVYDPNSRRMVPSADLMIVEHQAREAANKQPSKKKRSHGGMQRSGSDLARGTVARSSGTIVEGMAQERQLSRRESPVTTQLHAKQESQVLKDEPAVKTLIASPPAKDQRNIMTAQELPQGFKDTSVRTPSHAAQDANERNTSPLFRSTLGKRPSVVREDPEDDDDEEVPPPFVPSREILDALDAVPTRQNLYNQSPERRDEDGSPVAQHRKQPLPAWHAHHAHSEPVAEGSPETKPALADNKPVTGLSRDEDSSVYRSTSSSPAHTARFALTTSEKLAVRHTPPPRSASPIKSALKQSSPSPRTASPDNGSDNTKLREVSSEVEPPISRKKSVRVSFDDRSTVVVGEAAQSEDVESPAAPSPQQHTKRPWYSNIGRNKKKDFALEDDEVMKPRPALPSFGSVREKKRESGLEERPLVRPHDPSHPQAAPSPNAPPYSPNKATVPSRTDISAMGKSSDQVLGSVLAQDQASRNEANISRFREPLPPVVTSLEGNGYVSDNTFSSVDSDEERYDSVLGDSDVEAMLSTHNTQSTPPETLDNSQSGSMMLEEKPTKEQPPKAIELPANEVPTEVPTISVVQPSPGVNDYAREPNKHSKPQYFELPGGFPEDESEASPSPAGGAQKGVTTGDSGAPPTDNTIFEPEGKILPSQASSLPQTTLATTPSLAIVGEMAGNDTDSNTSIYSDAYEDLVEAERDDFMSLNAVVESPADKAQPTPPTPPAELPPNQPQEAGRLESEAKPPLQTQAQASEASHNSQFPPSESSEQKEWETIKSFWRSLSQEKRRQLEREAFDEGGTEGDRDEDLVPVRRLSSRKKTAEERQATAVAAKARAERIPKPVQPVNQDRVYMIQPGAKANHEPVGPTTSGRMRTSMREEQPGQSARVAKAAPGEVHLRKSMRPNAATDAVDQHKQPVTSLATQPAPPPKPNTRLQNAQIHRRDADFDVALAAGNAFSHNPNPALDLRGSDLSDSSFKRKRTGPSEGSGFRSTMRQTSPDATQETRRFSLRSLSPGGSPFRRPSRTVKSGPPVSTPIPTSMRRTLRSGSESSRERGTEGRRTSMFSSFGRSSKISDSRQSNHGSRLGDSSEDDEPAASAFRSRYEDSSSDDADMEIGVMPIAPPPKSTMRSSTAAANFFKKSATVPEEEEDSPELPDSDDEMPSPLHSPQRVFRPTTRLSSGIGTSTLQRRQSERESLVRAPITPAITAGKTRNSLMGSILRRNKKADHDAKIQRSELMESAARQDTKLERNDSQLRSIRRDSQSSSPKLRKRKPMARGSSWPLPEPDQERPSTAGGFANGGVDATRPTFSSQRNTSLNVPATTGLDATDTGESDAGVPKKKKFMRLRKMFRLDD